MGEIEIENRPSHGSQIIVTFAGAARSVVMETVLIVDDEKNYPLILSAVLEEEGYETLTATSGEEALELLTHSDIDLVLTDMKMPSMDGIHLLEKIKAKDAESAGHHDDGSRDRGKSRRSHAKRCLQLHFETV